MTSTTAALLELAGELSGQTPDLLDRLLVELDVDPNSECAPRASSLNADGFPLQLCISKGKGSTGVRLLADPATVASAPSERWARGLTALRRIGGGAPAMLERVLHALDAARPEDLSWSSQGALWIGCDVAKRGVAAYVSTRWGEEQRRWPRAISWLAATVGRPSLPELEALVSYADVGSVGVEATVAGSARAKLYFRLNGPHGLEHLGLPPLLRGRCLGFLTETVSGRALHRNGLVFSVSYSMQTGAAVDVKLDVCGHCVPRSGAQWAGLLERVDAEQDDHLRLLQRSLHQERLELAFIGLGLAYDGTERLNVYLKPPTAPPRTETTCT